MGNREYQREYMAEKRAAEQSVTIPPVANPLRRLAAESDSQLFLETYFGDRFFDPWTEDRRAMLREIRARAVHGGDKAIAAPRGEGKTTIAELEVGLDAIVNGWLRFPLIVAATGPAASAILRNIKDCYEFPQPSGNDAFAEDYPEVCTPIRDLDGAPQKVGKQKVNGERTRMVWSGEWIQFPQVTLSWCPKCYWPEPRQRESHCECPKCGEAYKPWRSKASGSVIETRGLDAAIRGIRRGGLRPDMCVIDDGETRESARSEKQIADRTKIIDSDLGGLGGGRKRIGRLMLCTVMNSMCLSAQFTDPAQRPSWAGERIALVKRWPDRKDLWERYIETRKESQEQGDTEGRAAHRFYLENREAMDAGCVVSNEFRFSERIATDGEPLEVSTIEHVHNEASDKGWDYVFNELQNDPQDEATGDADKLTFSVVRGTASTHSGRCSGTPRCVVPDTAEFVTTFVDVQHSRLYVATCSWLPGNRCHVTDYEDFEPSDRHRVIGVEAAIGERLRNLSDRLRTEPYHRADGSERQPDLIVVDSGDQQQAVVETVLTLGPQWRASKGEASYSSALKPNQDRRMSRNGDRWYESRQRLNGRQWWQIHFDPDWWRAKVHEAFRLTPIGDDGNPRPGSITLPGERPEQHTDFAHQICDRQWFREWVDDRRGWREGWTEGKNDHYLDCMIGNFVAKSMLWRATRGPAVKLSDIRRAKSAHIG